MISNANSTYNVTIGNTGGVSSSNAYFVSAGYGQVEPNHLSARRTAQIYAQLPAAADIEMLENGQFVKYDYANNEVNFTGLGEWMLVYNEIKLYENRDSEADFAMLRSNYTANVYDASGTLMPTGTVMVPRVFKTNNGDIMTTNCVDAMELTVGDVLTVDERSGLLVLTTNTNGHTLNAGTVGEGDTVLAAAGDTVMKWQVVKVYTMPDGQAGVKIVKVQ